MLSTVTLTRQQEKLHPIRQHGETIPNIVIERLFWNLKKGTRAETCFLTFYFLLLTLICLIMLNGPVFPHQKITLASYRLSSIMI